MTEETTNSSVNTETTEKQATDTFVPAWKIKADKVKEELGDNEQVFYESDQYFDCLPIARPKDAPNVFPFTSEEPTGFIAPKYNWGPIGKGWVETASLTQAKEIEMLKANVADLKEAADDVTKQQATDKIKSAQVMQMFQMTTKQIGAIDTKLDTVLGKLNAQSTTSTASSTTEGGNQ